MKNKKVEKKEAKVGGLDFEVVVMSSSGDLSKKIAEALEKKLEKEGKAAEQAVRAYQEDTTGG